MPNNKKLKRDIIQNFGTPCAVFDLDLAALLRDISLKVCADNPTSSNA